MEIEERRVTEIFLAIILVLIIIAIIFLFTNQDSEKKSSEISNSYNTNSYNTYNLNEYLYTDSYPTTNRFVYYSTDSYEREYLRYTSNERITMEERAVGGEISNYVVYVKNLDYIGGYFTVKFYFEDYYGRTRTESITKYIGAKEEEKFYYKALDSTKYNYYDWDYEVISRTKIPKV